VGGEIGLQVPRDVIDQVEIAVPQEILFKGLGKDKARIGDVAGLDFIVPAVQIGSEGDLGGQGVKVEITDQLQGPFLEEFDLGEGAPQLGAGVEVVGEHSPVDFIDVVFGVDVTLEDFIIGVCQGEIPRAPEFGGFGVFGLGVDSYVGEVEAFAHHQILGDMA